MCQCLIRRGGKRDRSSAKWQGDLDRGDFAALYIYVANEKGSNGRAGAAVLGALSVQSLWGPTLFSLFTVYILRADAALVGIALKLDAAGRFRLA